MKAFRVSIGQMGIRKYGCWLILGFLLLALIFNFSSDESFIASYNSFLSYQEDVPRSESIGQSIAAGQNSTVNEPPVFSHQEDVPTSDSQPTVDQNSTPNEAIGKEPADKIDRVEKLSCNRQYISDICEMEGDIRIHGKTSNVSLVISDQNSKFEGNITWKIKPFARKFQIEVMEHVREVEIKTLINDNNTPKCDVYHDIPAIIFSRTGFSNHIYHAFADVLVPLFTTSFQFNGEVQFLISSMDNWWTNRHKPFIKNLTNYEIIDFDNEEKIHCYSRVIVGLHRHNDLTMDPSISPKNVSSVDLGNYIRKAYSLRDRIVRFDKNSKTKPRLFIIARTKTRKFINLESIVQTAEELGFEVTVGDAIPDLTECARKINSFDAMMGVHGAGLTNFIFLPMNAVHIQIVPFGHLEGMAKYDYGTPAIDIGLNYLQYSIDINESTLTDIYARDDPVFTDPDSIHKKGWGAMAEVYMGQQDVNLNITRFRPVLVQGLEILSSVYCSEIRPCV